MEKKRYITRIEASKIFNVHPQTITNWMERGVLVGKNTGHNILVDYLSIEKLISSFGDITEVEKNIETYKTECRELEKEYKQLSQNLKSRNWIYSNVIRNAKILANLFENAFCKLSRSREERTIDIVRMFLKGHTFEEIGDKYSLQRVRIGQIIRKGVYQLRYADTYKDLIEQNKHLMDINIKLSTENTKLTKKLQAIDQRDKYITEVLNHKIESYPLSNKTLNCLQYAQIRTLGELAQHNRREISSLRSIGTKSMKELDDLLASNHLQWGTPYEFSDMKE
ncbi:DNA-directed RNA polymerase subunit alpha C-terminal domain-containing protein [uncultured Bacteroides sp.]|uniref:DNA-directed RNA polymerase subunit alpha C-terminal domain-containing protein n=1 Tax=uncultured Bacteroides sp. TaxID=162156 RepID=UPI00280B03E0|nr:DNA-directed RNA polymerase subunit alpha C-terminal domain-containing protein [uncultured Bacteroides sp.]